ncbi:MAG: hypothetical protein RLZZ192_464 [Pseudomonadota bacterium]|jgi:hypothetical protein
MQDTITLPELEAAINFWRQRSPSVGEELRLCVRKPPAWRRLMLS